MATEKDKTKAAAVKMYLDEHPVLGKNGPVDWEQIEFAVRFADAARADAITECAKAGALPANKRKLAEVLFTELNGQQPYGSTDEIDYTNVLIDGWFDLESIAEKILALRSLSSKQEEPR